MTPKTPAPWPTRAAPFLPPPPPPPLRGQRPARCRAVCGGGSSRSQPACGLWIAKSPSEGKAVWPATQQEGTRGSSSKTPRTKNRYRHQNSPCKPHTGPSQPCASSGNTSRLSSWGRHAVRTLTWPRRNHPLLFLLPPPGLQPPPPPRPLCKLGRHPFLRHFTSTGWKAAICAGALEQDSSLPSAATEMSENQALTLQSLWQDRCPWGGGGQPRLCLPGLLHHCPSTLE